MRPGENGLQTLIFAIRPPILTIRPQNHPGANFYAMISQEVRTLKETKKPKYSMAQNIGFMLRRAWKIHKSVLVLCVVYAVLEVGINLAQLFIAPAVLEKVEQLAPLTQLLGTIGLFSLILVVLNGLREYVDLNTLFGRVDIRANIINDINYKACTTSYPNTRDPEILKMQENAMNACEGNDEPTEYIWTTLTSLLLNIVGFFIYLMLLSELNIALSIIVVVTTTAGFFVSRHVNEWVYRHREEEAQYYKKMGYIRKKTESVALAKDIRIFGLGPWLNAIYESTLNLYDAFIMRKEKKYILACVADVVLGFCRNGIAYLYLIHLTLNKNLAASEFLLYFTAFSGFSTWVTGILNECAALHKESIRISVVQEYLNLPEPFCFEGGISIPKAEHYELRLEHVTFCYPNTDKEIIHNLNLTIHPGEKLAIVGLNGAGKTTLVKLLCGLYDPDKGRVLLNGIDIRKFNRREYYAMFSAVFQEFSDLDVTVAQTVSQTVENIDMERVKDCIVKAGLTQKVEELPHGYDTHLGKKVYLDGVQLSGGQNQRLMLARALYKDGPILVLDEPTAALDPIAENDIYTKYSEMTAGKTSVFISHRLASTRFCDRILFLKDGVIAEEGTHESLMQLGGGYANLFEVQARYYQEGWDYDGEEI